MSWGSDYLSNLTPYTSADTIISHLRRRFAVEAKVWLAAPFLPITGVNPLCR